MTLLAASALSTSALSASAGDTLAGPAALLIVLVLLIATIFLIRNMDKRLKRLPREFPPPAERRHRGDDEPAPPEA